MVCLFFFHLAADVAIKWLGNTLYRGISKLKWILVFHLFSEQGMKLLCEAVASVLDFLLDATFF